MYLFDECERGSFRRDSTDHGFIDVLLISLWNDDMSRNHDNKCYVHVLLLIIHGICFIVCASKRINKY